MATKSKRGVEWAKAVRTFPNGRTVKFNLPVSAPAKKQRKARKKKSKGSRAGRASSGPITNPARLLGSGSAPAARSSSARKTQSKQKGKRGKKDKSGGQLQLLG